VRPLKYGNKPTSGYASKRELNRALELQLLQRAGKIEDLREQVPFELIPKQDGERSCKYVADFVYAEMPSGVRIVEDAKGYRDPVYRIKRKLMKFVHGITVREV
jgi:hypothetical protein